MRTDVLVIGAGPAGSALARQLGSAGIAVAIADKKRFPRDKPCGEFFSPQCQPLLASLGLGELLNDLDAHRVTGMRLHAGAARATGNFRRLNGSTAPATGFGVRRSKFDAALLRAAQRTGARLLERHAFDGLLRNSDGRVEGALLRTPDGARSECRARYVIGADGVHSRVAQAMAVQRRIDWLDQFALVAHFDDVEPLPTAEVHLLRGGFFAATTTDAGQFGVNLVLPRRALRQRGQQSWHEFAMQHCAAAPHFAERLRTGHRITPWRGTGPFAFRTTTQTMPGAALVGDAAGYVDPLTGEGIYFALFGANALGTALREALDAPAHEAAAMANYRRERRRELGARLCSNKALQRGLRSPWIVRRFLGALRRWPSTADLIVTLSGDTVHPRDIWRPGFWRAFRRAAT